MLEVSTRYSTTEGTNERNYKVDTDDDISTGLNVAVSKYSSDQC
jgi:hypothetical protein